MAKSSPTQNSFNGGELSPLMEGRVDVKRYQSGARKVENFHLLSAGPARRRSGTSYVQETLKASGSTKNVVGRLQPFVYSTTTAYVLSFTDLTLRVFKEEAFVSSSQISTVYTEAQLFDLNFTQSADVLYVAHQSHPPYKIQRTSDSAWTTTLMEFQDGPYLDENVTNTTLTFASVVINTTVTVTASANVFVSGDADTNPGGPINNDGRLIRWKHPEGFIWGWGRVVAFSSATSVTMHVHRSPDQSNDATKRWRLGAWGYDSAILWPGTVTFHQNRLVYAGSFGLPETIWASVTGDYETFSPTEDVASDEDPLAGSSTAILPASAYTFTLSAGFTGQVNAIQWLAPTDELVVGTNGGISNLSSDQQGPVTPQNVLVRQSNVFGAKNVQPVRVADFIVHASFSGLQLRGIGYSFSEDAWVSEDLTEIAETIFVGVTQRADSRIGVIQMAYQREPHGVIWSVRGDGQLVALTLNKTQKVVAFGRHIVGGTFGPQTFTDVNVDIVSDPPTSTDNNITITTHGFIFNEEVRLRTTSGGALPTPLRNDIPYYVIVVSANAIRLADRPGGPPVPITSATGTGTHSVLPNSVVESIAVIPATLTSSDHDQVWLIVKRTIDGSTTRYIEFMQEDFPVQGDKTAAWFVDAGYTQSGTDLAITTASNLDHLIGETVQILGDGSVQAERVVDSSGQVVIDPVADQVQVGLKFESNLETNHFELPDQAGTSQAKHKRNVKTTLRLDSTAEAKIGTNVKNLITLDLRSPNDPMDEAAPLFTGDTDPIEMNDEPDRESRVYVRQDLPLPITVVGIFPWFDGANR